MSFNRAFQSCDYIYIYFARRPIIMFWLRTVFDYGRICRPEKTEFTGEQFNKPIHRF